MHIHSNLSLSTRSVSFSFSFFTRSVFRCLSFFQVDSSIQHVLNRMFISSKKASFYFSTLTHNDRGYGHLAVCGSIRCRGTTRWMREQNCRNARQPANEHRRVLWPVVLFLFSRYVVWGSIHFWVSVSQHKIVTNLRMYFKVLVSFFMFCNTF